MTKKIYLETFKKCPRSLCFPLLPFLALRKTPGVFKELKEFKDHCFRDVIRLSL